MTPIPGIPSVPETLPEKLIVSDIKTLLDAIAATVKADVSATPAVGMGILAQLEATGATVAVDVVEDIVAWTVTEVGKLADKVKAKT